MFGILDAKEEELWKIIMNNSANYIKFICNVTQADSQVPILKSNSDQMCNKLDQSYTYQEKSYSPLDYHSIYSEKDKDANTYFKFLRNVIYYAFIYIEKNILKLGNSKKDLTQTIINIWFSSMYKKKVDFNMQFEKYINIPYYDNEHKKWVAPYKNQPKTFQLLFFQEQLESSIEYVYYYDLENKINFKETKNIFNQYVFYNRFLVYLPYFGDISNKNNFGNYLIHFIFIYI